MTVNVKNWRDRIETEENWIGIAGSFTFQKKNIVRRFFELESAGKLRS